MILVVFYLWNLIAMYHGGCWWKSMNIIYKGWFSIATFDCWRAFCYYAVSSVNLTIQSYIPTYGPDYHDITLTGDVFTILSLNYLANFVYFWILRSSSRRFFFPPCSMCFRIISHPLSEADRQVSVSVADPRREKHWQFSWTEDLVGFTHDNIGFNLPKYAKRWELTFFKHKHMDFMGFDHEEMLIWWWFKP